MDESNHRNQIAIDDTTENVTSGALNDTALSTLTNEISIEETSKSTTSVAVNQQIEVNLEEGCVAKARKRSKGTVNRTIGLPKKQGNKEVIKSNKREL